MPVSPDVSDFRSYVIGLSAPVNSAGECASQAPMKEQVKYTSFRLESSRSGGFRLKQRSEISAQHVEADQTRPSLNLSYFDASLHRQSRSQHVAHRIVRSQGYPEHDNYQSLVDSPSDPSVQPNQVT